MPRSKKPDPTHDPNFFLDFVDADHASCIGMVAVQWSIMENFLDDCIWKITRVELDHGRTLSAQLQVQSKLDALGALLLQAKSPWADQFKRVAQYVRDCLQGERNKAIHGFWITDPGTETVFVFHYRARGRLVRHGGAVDLQKMRTLAHDIASVTAWLSQLSDSLPTLRKKRGVKARASQDAQPLQDCATRKQQALQLPALPPK